MTRIRRLAARTISRRRQDVRLNEVLDPAKNSRSKSDGVTRRWPAALCAVGERRAPIEPSTRREGAMRNSGSTHCTRTDREQGKTPVNK